MSDRVKVLVVIGQLEVGGTEMHLLNVLPDVNQSPLEIIVYALRGGGRLHGAFERAGIRVISPAHHSRRWLGLLRTAWHFLTTWRRERPDVVHYFLPEAYLLGGLCSVVAPACRLIMSRRSLNDYQHKWPGARALERWLHRRMDAVLANSTAVADQLAAEGVPDARRAVLYNGVLAHAADPAAATALRESLGIDQGAIVFVMVANLIPYKGHADLIATLALARDALPDDWAMLFAGADSGIRETLTAAATHASIDQHIHWLGRIEQPGRAYDAADIAIHASHEEGFSNAVLEAMAAGLPVIATAVGGNVDAVIDGETGLLVAPHTPAAIAAALVALASDPARRAALGQAGRERVLRNFSMAECCAAYRRLYGGITGDSPARVDALIAGSA
ncbi:MAG: glycosyltransferase [Gammaproteobacteria bacterium]